MNKIAVFYLSLIITCALTSKVNKISKLARGFLKTKNGEDLGSHFITNPDNQVGKAKTITIDGTPSGWSLDMKIAQGVANDDPRVFAHWSMHEIAIDDYALFAAWDDEKLYLMWEMINVSDFYGEDFPISQGRLSIYNLPIFIFMNVEGKGNHGIMENGKSIWDSGITVEEKVDRIIACSTNGANGPYIYKYDESKDAFPMETELKGKASGIEIASGMGILDTEVWGIPGAGSDNRKIGDVFDDEGPWEDFYTKKHDKQLDMTYEMSIELSKLGVTREYIETKGIGIVKVSTFGTSGMDCLPGDKSMTDNADKPYSKDPSTSMEKEDEDHITAKLARIGHL